jgi:hypothetical protein
LFLGVAGQVGAFGQILSDQAVGVLVGASLPGTMRITEVHGDAGRLGEFPMVGHLLTLIIGQAEAERLGNPLEFVGEGRQDVGFGRLGVRQPDQDEQPTARFYQGADGAGIPFALDEVTLPVSRKLAILDLRRTQVGC